MNGSINSNGDQTTKRFQFKFIISFPSWRRQPRRTPCHWPISGPGSTKNTAALPKTSAQNERNRQKKKQVCSCVAVLYWKKTHTDSNKCRDPVGSKRPIRQIYSERLPFNGNDFGSNRNRCCGHPPICKWMRSLFGMDNLWRTFRCRAGLPLSGTLY